MALDHLVLSEVGRSKAHDRGIIIFNILRLIDLKLYLCRISELTLLRVINQY